MSTKNYKTIGVHINNISAGDTIIHDDKMRTVCNNNMKYCSFMGKSIFGDSYMSGHKTVEKVIFVNAKDSNS